MKKRCPLEIKRLGNWLHRVHLTCGTFEYFGPLRVFRPNIGNILFHASGGPNAFRQGLPDDDAIWLGAYVNSIGYIRDYMKKGEQGYMNVFKIKKRPRLLLLNDPENMAHLLTKVKDKQTRHAISTSTGIGRRRMMGKRSLSTFACQYTQKDTMAFSRFSSRMPDRRMAHAICRHLWGIHGYIQPNIIYCEHGTFIHHGRAVKGNVTFSGEVALCHARRYLTRIGAEAIVCQPGGKACRP